MSDINSEHRKAYLLAWMDGLRFNKKHLLVMVVCTLGLMFDSMDLQIAAFVAPLIRKEWGLTPKTLGLIISAASFGAIGGSYFFGIVSDRLGRITGFQTTIGIFSIFSALSALAKTTSQLIPLRFLTGFGLGGLIPIDASVITEYIPARLRGRMVALYACAFPLGGVMAAWGASWIIPRYGWRGLFVYGAVPAILIFIIRWFVPETPRFLMRKGRLDEAERSVRWVADNAQPPDEATITVPDKVIPESKQPWTKDLADLFNPVFRKRTILTWSIWLGSNIPYYGMILWLPTLLAQFYHFEAKTVVAFALAYQLSGVAGRLVMMSLVDFIGRKPIIIGTQAICAVMILIFGLQQDYNMLLLTACIFNFFNDGNYSAAAPFTAEVYPTRLRSTGVGWGMGAGRIGGAISPAIIGFMIGEFSLYAVFTLFAVCYAFVAVITAILGFETKGQGLEAIGEGAEIKG